MDDTFANIKNDRQADFNGLNSIFTDIHFTMEKEKDGALPFPDILVCRRNNGEIRTLVFRKTTDTLQMHSYKSEHPQTHKRRCVKVLFKRVETHCSTPKAKEEELLYLKRQFFLTCFPSSFIQKTLQKRPAAITGTRPDVWQAIPYVANTSEAVARLLKPQAIGVAHRQAGTLRSRLMTIKDRIDPSEHSSIVHRAQCKDCSSI